MASLPHCPQCASTLTHRAGVVLACPERGHEWKEEDAVAAASEDTSAAVIRDAFGMPLADGDKA